MISLASATLGNHKRTKHFLGYINFLTQSVTESIITILHIESTENLAEIFTKPLAVQDLLRLRNKILGKQPSTA